MGKNVFRIKSFIVWFLLVFILLGGGLTLVFQQISRNELEATNRWLEAGFLRSGDSAESQVERNLRERAEELLFLAEELSRGINNAERLVRFSRLHPQYRTLYLFNVLGEGQYGVIRTEQSSVEVSQSTLPFREERTTFRSDQVQIHLEDDSEGNPGILMSVSLDDFSVLESFLSFEDFTEETKLIFAQILPGAEEETGKNLLSIQIADSEPTGSDVYFTYNGILADEEPLVFEEDLYLSVVLDVSAVDEFIAILKGQQLLRLILTLAIGFVVSAIIAGFISINLERKRQLKYLSDHDKLTGLINQRSMHKYLKTYIKEAYREKKVFSLCMVDIDQLKAINDTAGFEKGDEVIVKVAEVVQDKLRSADVVSRYGGDEFLLLLEECPEEGAHAIFSRIREAILKYNDMHLDDIHLSLTTVILQYDFEQMGADAEPLILKIQEMLQQEKRRKFKQKQEDLTHL